MKHYQYLFDNISTDQKDMLVALLSNIGFHGFEENENHLLAYTNECIDSTILNDQILPLNVSYIQSEVPEKNWNEIWESSFLPVSVYYPGEQNIFVNIRAHFHLSSIKAKYEIIITPKMSFGTGHHETTYGMVSCMSSLDFKNKKIVDFGTGTGILAILAEKLGAANITAIDNDDWSLRNAAENIQQNNCTKISLIKAESIGDHIKADIILANINLSVIMSSLHQLHKSINKKGVIVLSGILKDNKDAILVALKKYAMKITVIHERRNWLVIVINNEN